MRQLKLNLEDIVLRHSNEIQKIKDELSKKHSQEIEQLHNRIKQTITKKDQMVAVLQEELHIAEAKLQQQQILLEKQRSKLL